MAGTGGKCLTWRRSDEVEHESRRESSPQKLPVLKLAQALGSMSEACRRLGLSRQSLYEYKLRFAEARLVGLKDLPPVPKSHSMSAPEAL
jgi:hypothetical protein